MGKVIEIGKKVKGLSVGARVASSHAHTSHFLSSTNGLIEIRDPTLPSEEAVFFNLCAIALQGVRKANIELGESVLVLGQGLIGLLAMQLAKLSGGLPVIGVDFAHARLKLAVEVGADDVLHPENEDFDQRSAELAPSVVVEATGRPEAINTAFSLAGWCGRVVLLASTRGETERVNFYCDIHKKGLHVIGAHNSVRPRQESSRNFWTSQDDWELTLRLLGKHRVIVQPLISHRLRGIDAPQAYRQLMEWDANLLGVVLHWNASAQV